MKHVATSALALAQLLAPVPLLVSAPAFGAPAQTLRDPFARPAPPAAAVTAAPEPVEAPPQLRAIMYSPSRSLANINGQILATGEWIGNYQLIKVEERAVTLMKRGVKSVLVLDEASRK